jgi:hypothetical protein
MIKAIGVGIGVFGSLLGSFLAGMEVESRLSSDSVAEAEETGFRRGLAEAEANYAAVEGPMAEFAAQLALVLGSPSVQANLSDEVNAGIKVSLDAAGEGDFDAAVKALPSLVQLAETPNCIKKDQLFEMEANQFVDSCDAGSTLMLTEFFNSSDTSPLWLSVDGKKNDLRIGDEREIGNGCLVSFLRGVLNSSEQRQAAVLRIECR